MHTIAPLFDGVEETLIWSCLQGRMGRAWADESQTPRAAQIVTGDFSFLAGDAFGIAARALAAHIPDGFPSPSILMIPCAEEWEPVIESSHTGRCNRTVRYALKKEADVFDAEKLTALAASLPDGYSLSPIGDELYPCLTRSDWCGDFCSQFASCRDYCANGLGFAALYGGEVVAGASSYTVYNGGIEIEVDTRGDHRRKGLAAACAARLILECLRRGLYPSWDAANPTSLRLAEKLGYHFAGAYTAYTIDLTALKQEPPKATAPPPDVRAGPARL